MQWQQQAVKRTHEALLWGKDKHKSFNNLHVEMTDYAEIYLYHSNDNISLLLFYSNYCQLNLQQQFLYCIV